MESQLSKQASQLSKPFSTHDQRDAWLMSRILEGEALKPGSPVLNPEALELLLDLYSRTLTEIGPDRFLAAFQAVLESSPFRPDISEIRKAAGVNHGIVNPVEREALDALKGIFAAMRKHGPKLREIPGAWIERDAEGNLLERPLRGQGTPAPAFGDAVELAISEVGWGSREDGLAALSEHPAMYTKTLTGTAEAPAIGWREKNASDIEKRWVRAYVQAVSNSPHSLSVHASSTL